MLLLCEIMKQNTTIMIKKPGLSAAVVGYVTNCKEIRCLEIVLVIAYDGL